MLSNGLEPGFRIHPKIAENESSRSDSTMLNTSSSFPKYLWQFYVGFEVFHLVTEKLVTAIPIFRISLSTSPPLMISITTVPCEIISDQPLMVAQIVDHLNTANGRYWVVRVSPKDPVNIFSTLSVPMCPGYMTGIQVSEDS